MPVMIAACTAYRYAIIWSYVITLSYYAYHTHPVEENLGLVAAEYLIVISYAYWEFKIKRKPEEHLA